MVFWSIVMNRWKTGTAIHNQSCTYKTYLDDNTFCCAITQLLIIKGEHHRENLITISLAPTNITMGKVSSFNVTGNAHWKLFWLIILISYFIVDHILRRQKFPRSASWVHEWLCWPSPLLQPLQLYPSGEWLFCGLWEIPLPGPPVLLAQGGVLWQPAHDWYQWLHPILPYDSSGESDVKKKHRRIICVSLQCTLILLFLQHRGSYKIRLYERSDMAGQMQEVSDDCPNIQDRLRMPDINSCNVVDGHWLLYDQPNYRGRTYYLRPGEYRRYSDWGGASPRIGSLRRITDFN